MKDMPHETCQLKIDASIPVRVIAEDKNFLVIDKPAGLLVHPIPKHCEGTLVNALLARAPEIAKVGENPLRPGIVHRLDKDVSGAMVVAKTQEMFIHLKKQFAGRLIKKEYLAWVYGAPSKPTGEITFSLGKTKKGLMAARPRGGEGKEALTQYEVIKTIDKRFALLKLRILTGRTHQIRAHLKAIGHPVVGDPLYTIKRIKKTAAPQLMLHAATLGFTDLNGQWREFNSPPPKEFDNLMFLL